MDSEVYSISWNEHRTYVVEVFGRFWEEGTLVDCTIAAEGKYLKARRLMLSACSPYFERLFRQEMDKDKGFVLKGITFENLKSLIAFMYHGHVTVPKERVRDFVRAAECLQIKGLPSGLVHSLQREVTEMSDKSGKEGLASHQSHKRMRRSLVGTTREFQCENIKTSSIARMQSGDERSFNCLQTDLSQENVFSQPLSVLANDSKRETGVVPADKEPSAEPKEEMEVEGTPIWESEDENTSTVTDLFTSGAVGEENRNQLTSVPDTVSSSYGRAASFIILEIKAESSVPSSCSVTSIPSSANSSSPMSYIPNVQRNDSIEGSSSCVRRELAAQGVSVKNEPVVKTVVIPAVFSFNSECTVEPIHEEWVEEMRSWEGEEVMIETDSAVFCSKNMANEDYDVSTTAVSDLYHPGLSPSLIFTTSTSSTVEAEGERKEVNVHNVKVEKPEVNKHYMGQECKSIEVNDSTVDKMVENTQYGVVESDESDVEKEDLVMVETIEETLGSDWVDAAEEQNEAEEEEDSAPLFEHVSEMLGKESNTCPDVSDTVSDVQVHLKKQQRKKRSIECGVCKATFGSKSKFMTHTRIHTGERPFQCEMCEKSFSQPVVTWS